MSESIEWKVDRKGWPAGPWDGEPDRIEWRHLGVVCLMVRVEEIGTWCGYVGVPAGHPWHSRYYKDIAADVIEGLNYSDACSPPICHVPQPGEEHDLWWVGFNGLGARDLMPKFGDRFVHVQGMRYRTVAFMKAEVERLAAQAVKAAGH
jgi:hypothetical protein